MKTAANRTRILRREDAAPAPPSARAAGFSLVEVTLALGIMGFALVSLIGMLPIGLATFRSAEDNASCTQIAQRLLGEAQQTDFDQLVGTGTKQTLRYFDEQGSELLPANQSQAIYRTNLVAVQGTTLPGGVPNQNLATVFLQIANNPGGRPVTTGADMHWTAPAGMAISSYAANVARNK